MVNNIAANVLGGKPELEDGAQMEGIQAFINFLFSLLNT